MHSQVMRAGRLRGSVPMRPSSRLPAVKCAAAQVTFKCHIHVNFGESVLVTGAEPALGAWSPASALTLNWTAGDVWTSEAEIPAGAKLEYKFIVKKKDGYEWQQGQNKAVNVPAEAAKLELFDQFTGGAQTKVVVLTAAEAPAAEAPVPLPPSEVLEASAAVEEEAAPAVVNPDLEAKIHEAELAAASYEADKVTHVFAGPVSTVENVAAEEVVVGHGQLANNIVQGIPAGMVSVSSAPDAQTAYEEADKFEVLEVGAQQVATTKARSGPGALDHYTMNELRTELKRRGLPASGNRRKLITTLQAAGAL